MVYLDDILITGSTDADYVKSLQQTLQHLEEIGLRLQKEKLFMVPSVRYQIDIEALHLLPDKVEAIK